jgi:hypothetical protein
MGVSERLALNSGSGEVHELKAKLMRLQLLNSHLHVGGKRRPERVCSLPAEVVEFLYEMLDPESESNPFRKGVSRWRIYTVFILLLHQGLRRGELLISATDVIKHSTDQKLGRDRFWMDVKYKCDDNDDPRYSTPSIKTAPSIRQIPVSKT